MFTDIDKFYEKLKQVEITFGLTGVIVVLLLVIGIFIVQKQLSATIKAQIKIGFDKQLSDYNKEIQKELSQLNIALSTLSTKFIGNVDKEREAFLEYLSAYSYWLHGTLDIEILSFKSNNSETIDLALQNIRRGYLKTNESWNKLRFWCTNEELWTSSHNLNMALLEYSHLHDKILTKMRDNLVSRQFYHNQFLELRKENKRDKDLELWLATEYDDYSKKIDELVKEFYEERLLLHKKVVEKNQFFQHNARNYLNHG